MIHVHVICNLLKEKHNSGLLLSVDFETELDNHVPTYFNLAESIRKCVSLFYSNITSAVNQEGTYQQRFVCIVDVAKVIYYQLSPYMFKCVLESFFKSTNVKGVILLMAKKISMLADETSLILDISEKSLQSSLNIIWDFAKTSGLSGLHIN